MADAPRHRPVEYYNPRPMILGLCFFWGIAMGFCLFYFAPPKQMMRPEAAAVPAPVVPAALTDRERRRLDTPNIADVAPAPEEAQDQRPRLETMTFEPPPPLLTTEGGLTGRTARPLDIVAAPLPASLQPAAPQPGQMRPQTQPYAAPAPPPIPELFP